MTLISKLFMVFVVSNLCFSQSLYDYSLELTNGEKLNFNNFKGKKVILVNIATQCGYTPQLAEIENFYKNQSKKIEVIGIPSNDFGGQAPESDKEIATFCQRNYGASFLITKKYHVTGNDKHPLYAYIEGLSKSKIKWNFEKVIFDEKGNFLKKLTSSESIDLIK